MFRVTRRPSQCRSHARPPLPLVLVLSLLIAATATAARAQARPAQPQGKIASHQLALARLRSTLAPHISRAKAAQAFGARFQRGDVFLEGASGIQEYSPTGQLVETVPGTTGATTFCFDPSGQHLIVPGVGLFDSSGNPVPSNWASVSWAAIPNGGLDCVADGLGHVYGVSPSGITQYDLRGDVLQTFPVPSRSLQMSIALAPDECTMYYAEWEGPANTPLGPFNVCTDTQEAVSSFQWNNWQYVDDLQVLPDWQVLLQGDSAAWRVDASGQMLQLYSQGGGVYIRSLSLDPDGTSFWVCCGVNDAVPSSPADVFRYDMSTGQLVSAWPSDGARIVVYSPPLLGDANVETYVDSNQAGTAEAFLTPARHSGQLTSVHVFIDSSSTASQAIVGIYCDRFGRPGRLLAQGSITSVRPGAWNYASVPSVRVTRGQLYWIAVLSPSGGGTVAFRRSAQLGLATVSAQHNLSDLPGLWSGGRWRLFGSLSAYGS
jgi:hypothetical protein